MICSSSQEAGELAPGFDLAQIEELVREMPQAVLISSPDAIVTMNDAARALFRFMGSGEEIPLSRLEEIFETCRLDGRELTHEEWPSRRALRGERVVDMAIKVRRRDTGECWINNYCASPVRDASGLVRLAIVTVEEIGERLRLEEALRAGEERYRSLLTAIAAVVWTSGPDGDFTEPQTSWEAYTGQPWEKQHAWGWLEMIHPEDRVGIAEEWRRAIVSRAPYAHRGRLWHSASQDFRHYEARAMPMLHADGSIREWVGTYLDVHDRNLIADRERQARREAEAANGAKDEFLAVLSHELRTPLMPALLTSAALTERPDLPLQIRADLDIVVRNIQLETRLIDDLLDHTRIQSGKLTLQRETVNVEDLVREILRDAEPDYRRKDLTVRFTLEAGAETHMHGDPIRLRQILWNLLRNAMKFTPLGGRVDLTLRNPREGWLAVRLQDSGIGITPEMLPKIFSRFEQGGHEVTRRYGGLGLGLAITKYLVELHGGSIAARSEGSGKGATFTLEFATVPDPRARIRSELVALRPAAPPQHILLVEDHDDTRNVMTSLLRRHGHSVVAAASIAEALAAAKAEKFTLIISDLGLPDGDGRDLLPQLPAGLPAISLSGFGMEEDVTASRNAGFAAHLTKPVEFARLRSLIQELTRPSTPGSR